jgi:hypothetical protein
MGKKTKKSQLRPKTYRVLELAIEEGISLGWNRAHKHEENPHEETIKDVIRANVMLTIGEWFTFDDEENE